MAKKGIIRTLVDIIISLILGILVLWSLGYLAFFFYCIAFLSALFNGLFRRRSNMSRLLFIGTILTYIAGLFIPQLLGNIKTKNWIGAILFTLLITIIWFEGNGMKKGKRR